ncbi:MAG TPA: ABC transporter [Desulfosporosinus sp.]|jgi:ABC-2 type transport system ATP-binding protein|nr:ABC transporter [Desulfosporosinus sp.]
MIGTDIAISVSGIEKSYKNLKVLKKINVTVQKGSIFALLGSNGSGKTTMIKILTTLLKPDKGNAQICGFDVVRQSDQVRGKISLTGQSAAVDEILTGRENLRIIGKLRHLSDANNKTDELLEQFHLIDAADRRVATYSGGMRRKLDLAMSLIGTPSVVFLDEPTTGLDPQGRISMWEIIRDLSHSGVTVFLTTQYLDEADHLADQIAILNEGKIVAEGTAAELKKMIPHGHIELGFRDEKEVELARDLLDEYNASLDEEHQTLTIATDGSIKQMTNILNRLENGGIPVAVFSQKLPTLEDVFLTIIG